MKCNIINLEINKFDFILQIVFNINRKLEYYLYICTLSQIVIAN
jgi:hypothetical protein